MDAKTCSKCGEQKPLTHFEKRWDSKDGYRRSCRDCRAVQTSAAQQRWLERNFPKYWDLRAKSLNSWSARRKGKAGKIIQKSPPIQGKDLEILYETDPKCYYCRINLERGKVVFDHKIPLSRGGTHDVSNVCIFCSDCNQLKATRTEEEFKEFLVDYVSRFRLIPW